MYPELGLRAPRKRRLAGAPRCIVSFDLVTVEGMFVSFARCMP